MTKEEKKNMSIANCRICLLSKSNCANCPLNWALPTVLAEQVIEDMHNIDNAFDNYYQDHCRGCDEMFNNCVCNLIYS